MKNNTLKKSSLTLSSNDFMAVLALKKRMKLKSNAEVVRKGLELLEKNLENEKIREGLIKDSLANRKDLIKEIEELDSVVSDGLENEDY